MRLVSRYCDVSGDQAVAVGRALIRDGEVIIMDEPTAALGVEQTREVLNLIETLRSRGKTVIFISHNILQVLQVTNEIVGMIVGTKRDTVAAQE